jgi:PDZ domain-containing secreted protein
MSVKAAEGNKDDLLIISVVESKTNGDYVKIDYKRHRTPQGWQSKGESINLKQKKEH